VAAKAGKKQAMARMTTIVVILAMAFLFLLLGILLRSPA
jgi:hypothetical protein